MNEANLRQQELATTHSVASAESQPGSSVASVASADKVVPPDSVSAPISAIYIPGRRMKRMATRRGYLGSVDLGASSSSFVEEGSEEDFPDGHADVLLNWKVTNGQFNPIYRLNRTSKDFTFLSEILHLVDRIDMNYLYGLVTKYYILCLPAGAGLYLLGDLQVLYDSKAPDGVGYHVWKDNHKWKVSSWRFFPSPCVHVVETTGRIHVCMFFDKDYPMYVPLMERMLEHGLAIPPTPAGNTRTLAKHLVEFIKKRIRTQKAIGSIP